MKVCALCICIILDILPFALAMGVCQIIMSWINTDGRGVIRNISQKQNYARC